MREGDQRGGASDDDASWLGNPFDDDKLREECGVFGVWNSPNASRLTALGLHALQHRGQEAAGIVSFEKPDQTFHVQRRVGYVRDNFGDKLVNQKLPGDCALGHTRYSTAGSKGDPEIRDIQPLYAEMGQGGLAIAHNGNLTNAVALRRRLVDRGSIFQSSSDTECIIHMAARIFEGSLIDRLQDALRKCEGAYSVVALTKDGLIGVRDPMGIRPLVLGKRDDAWILASETCALDIVAAEYVRDVEPGEMIVITDDGIESMAPFQSKPPRFCIFEYVYFSRPDSVIQGRNVYEVRRRIGEELAREERDSDNPVEADMVCPVPDSGTPAAIGFAKEYGLPFELGIIRNQFVARTFIEPTLEDRELKVRLKLNVNASLVKGKRVILVDDSVVRGTTSRRIKDMIKAAGAKEVHFRVASPPTISPCFYGVDTPDAEDLMAARMNIAAMEKELEVDSLRFISLDGLYRACKERKGRQGRKRRYCDACFSGDYPVPPLDHNANGGPVFDSKDD
ncbi:MAG: amidophosphoribosyltransferase [Pseudomonadota bacterium]